MTSVLMVGNFLSLRGGHRHYCEDLADRFEARAWSVTRTSDRPGRVARVADMIKTTWSRRHSYAVAIVDVFSGPAFLWAEAIGFELEHLSIPYVLALRGGSLPSFAKGWPRRVRRLLSHASRVIAPSSYLRDELARFAPSISIIPNGLDLARYTARAREHVTPRFIWLRTFHSLYNPLLAVEAFALIRTKYRDATLRMVGSDRDGSKARVERRIHELDLGDSIVLVPGVDKSQVGAELARGDVFLNTSNVDNTPVTVLEAMASGMSVISTNVGGLPYLLENGRDALLVPPHDAPAMAQAMERLLVEPELSSRLSKRAIERSRVFDWSTVLARWDDLLRDVVR